MTKVDEIRCDSAVFSDGEGYSFAGGSGYEGYDNAITCQFYKDGQMVLKNGQRPSYAEGADDMGHGISLEVPEDAKISMGELRTKVSSDTGWDCSKSKDFERMNCTPL